VIRTDREKQEFYRRGREGRRETRNLRQSLPIQTTTALNELVLLEQPEENLTADYADNSDQDGLRKARSLPQKTLDQDGSPCPVINSCHISEHNKIRSLSGTSSKYLQEHVTAIVKR
jgi:hypothetical protein